MEDRILLPSQIQMLFDTYISPQVLAFLLVSFFVGSIPFGLWIGRIYGVDIRTLGSGNIGATNVYRNLGKLPGLATFFLDLFKGVFVILFGYLSSHLTLLGEWYYQPLFGMSAVIGHCFSPFLKGNGGKGVATSFGVFLYLIPLQAIFAFLGFVFMFILTRYVSLASLFATLTIMVLTAYSFGFGSIMTLCIYVICLIVIIRHRENIKRLVEGKENRFSRA